MKTQKQKELEQLDPNILLDWYQDWFESAFAPVGCQFDPDELEKEIRNRLNRLNDLSY
jgi:hypothetical protein